MKYLEIEESFRVGLAEITKREKGSVFIDSTHFDGVCSTFEVRVYGVDNGLPVGGMRELFKSVEKLAYAQDAELESRYLINLDDEDLVVTYTYKLEG